MINNSIISTPGPQSNILTALNNNFRSINNQAMNFINTAMQWIDVTQRFIILFESDANELFIGVFD